MEVTTQTTIHVSHNGTEYECEITAYGDVTCGGSDSHGSDEPAWVEVEYVQICNKDGYPVSARFEKLINKETYRYIEDALVYECMCNR